MEEVQIWKGEANREEVEAVAVVVAVDAALVVEELCVAEEWTLD